MAILLWYLAYLCAGVLWLWWSRLATDVFSVIVVIMLWPIHAFLFLLTILKDKLA